jgi:hypothetical protein
LAQIEEGRCARRLRRPLLTHKVDRLLVCSTSFSCLFTTQGQKPSWSYFTERSPIYLGTTKETHILPLYSCSTGHEAGWEIVDRRAAPPAMKHTTSAPHPTLGCPLSSLPPATNAWSPRDLAHRQPIWVKSRPQILVVQ